MREYRKKSTVKAVQWNPEGQMYSEDVFVQWGISPHNPDQERNTRGAINTKQGWQNVNVGDWLITNPDGERYPCNNKTFEETYEEVTNDDLS